VLYVGISDARAWWIAQANTLAKLRGWSSFIGLQVEYSLMERTVERELVPMAKALNLGFTAWSSLAGGMLTGKYHGHGSPEQGRMNNEMMKDFMPEQQRTDRIVAAVKAVSDETGRGMAQVALAWLRYRPVPVIPIIGARKPFSAAGQSCELQPGALSGTSKSTGRSEPDRSRIPISSLWQRACPRN
jgi:aryl-alcohol dehydrogenase-like predicted oxidoreductase